MPRYAVLLNGKAKITKPDVAPATMSAFVDLQRAKGNTVRTLQVTVPSIKAIKRWDFDGESRCPDGCRTEPDGSCQHGWPSWPVLMGLI